MLTESVTVVGNLEIKHLDSTGILKDFRRIKNLVVAAGKDVITARLIGNTLPVMSHMAVGSSNTAAASSQTALSSELDRVIFDSVTRTANTITFTTTFPAGEGTGTLQEAGIFNSNVSGNMLCRTTFESIVKASGDIIVISWNVTVA
jgi:hypothetical protein